MPGPCQNCGEPHAAFGFRRRGQVSRLPKNKQTMIFVCGKDPCMERARAWKKKADGDLTIERRPADPPKPKRPPADPPAQGSLF